MELTSSKTSSSVLNVVEIKITSSYFYHWNKIGSFYHEDIENNNYEFFFSSSAKEKSDW